MDNGSSRHFEGAPFPDMPAFDESKINPRDEYFVEEE
jgi:hypothetical protein